MGIALSSLAMLMLEHKRRRFSGTVLQVGRQDVYFEYALLERCAREIGVPLKKLDQVTYRPNEWMPELKTIDDIALFKALGFDRVESIDASDYEHPDHVHDMNLRIPAELHGRYDMIFDGGSFEHIFNLPNALYNVGALLKVGGRIIHHAPTHNYVDHGFYSFSPTFFYDYYEANHFTDIDCYLLGSRLPYKHNEMAKMYKYTPGLLEPHSVGGFTRERFDGCEMFVTTFTATKSSQWTGEVTPMQRRYREWWSNAKTKNAAK